VHVGLNLVFLVPGATGGMETYARELISALAERDDIKLTAFVNRAAARAGGPWAELAEQIVVPLDVHRRVQWVRGEQVYVPRWAQRAGVELLHSLASTAPLWGGSVRVTTIHDLNYRMVPEAHFGLRALGMRVLVPAAARRSHRLIVDAASTRRDLVEHLGVPAAKVDVIPLAAGSATPVTLTPEAELRERLNLSERPVALSVSAKRPHKNLARLIRALAAIPSERRPLLVVPGYHTPHEQELRALAAQLGVDEDLRLPEWVSPADLEGLYELATCAVLPSLYEGFGLPVLESMRRGLPVACSDRSSLPEVAGDAALLFDPLDVAAIKAAMERLLGDPQLRERLAQAGLARAQCFTWRATADATARVYEAALASA